jgi:hypothetical protein
VVHSHNHCCHGNATMRFVYCWNKYATLNNIRDIKSYCHENKIMHSLCIVQTHSAVHSIGRCHRNVTTDSRHTVKIQNILYRCQHYRRTEVFTWSAWYFCLAVTKYGFPWDFNKSPITNYTKIHPVAAKLMHADSGMERHIEANRTFLQHANMPKWKWDWGSGS